MGDNINQLSGAAENEVVEAETLTTTDYAAVDAAMIAAEKAEQRTNHRMVALQMAMDITANKKNLRDAEDIVDDAKEFLDFIEG